MHPPETLGVPVASAALCGLPRPLTLDSVSEPLGSHRTQVPRRTRLLKTGLTMTLAPVRGEACSSWGPGGLSGQAGGTGRGWLGWAEGEAQAGLPRLGGWWALGRPGEAQADSSHGDLAPWSRTAPARVSGACCFLRAGAQNQRVLSVAGSGPAQVRRGVTSRKPNTWQRQNMFCLLGAVCPVDKLLFLELPDPAVCCSAAMVLALGLAGVPAGHSRSPFQGAEEA